MAFGKYPRSEVHLNVERINLPRFQIARSTNRLSLRSIDSCARDLRERTIRSYVGEACEPIRQGRARRRLKQRMRSPQDCELMVQRRRIVHQAECVHRAGIAKQLAPPEAGLDSDRRNVFQLMRGSSWG